MGMGDELGLLAPGYLADLLVVRGNPAQDVTLLQDAANIEWIVQGGRAPQAAGAKPGGLIAVADRQVGRPRRALGRRTLGHRGPASTHRPHRHHAHKAGWP